MHGLQDDLKKVVWTSLLYRAVGGREISLGQRKKKRTEG